MPYNKIGGFFSDAHSWNGSTGKLLSLRKSLHNVLEEMVYLDHIDRDTAIDIAKAVINENAIKLYKI